MYFHQRIQDYTSGDLTFEPESLNVLIRVNGAGKSNFISFFRFLQWMLTPPRELQAYVPKAGAGPTFILRPGKNSRNYLLAGIARAGVGKKSMLSGYFMCRGHFRILG